MGTSETVCVYCRRQPVNPVWRPFCSERCKMADLGRWLTGGYSIPVEEDAPGEDDPEHR